MAQALYFHIILEPHHKHSGSRTGRQIRLLAEVPLSTAKMTARSPDDEQSTYEEAERLASNLTAMAMTGHPHQPGEDDMRVSFHSIPRISDDFTGRRPDAEKDGVRVWLLGADLE
ncbi:MAG: hypothetical protein WB586_12390 [Chthoniobacterales bacterium]